MVLLHLPALSILVSLVFGDCWKEATYDKDTKLYVNAGSQIGCQPLGNSPLSLGSVTVKEYIGQEYNIKYEEIWSHFGIIFASIALLQVLSLLALRYFNHQKR